MMHPAEDFQLLKAHLAGSPEAFTELVERHTPLIYSAALRQTRDPHMADDITQAVFLLLSQKAHRLGQSTILTAWLYRATRFAALDAIKKQRRRQHHEAVAALSKIATPETDPWTEISPLLDDAMNHLREKDRTAILLRYFENKSLRDVSTTLGTTEAAAGQRINRALDRLRDFFSRRNITIPTATLSTTLARHAIAPAPPHLLLPTLPSPTAATIAKGAATMMFWTKIKLTTIAALLILAISIPPLLLETKAQTPTNPPPNIAPPSSSAQPVQINLPNGARIELPCLIGTAADSNKTWAPDGTLLDPSLFPVAINPKNLDAVHLESDQHIVLFPLRVTQIKTSDTFFMMAGNNGGVVGKVLHDNKPDKDTWVWAETFDRTQPTASAQIRMELYPWRLLATWDSRANNTDMTTDDPHFQVQPGIPAVRDNELIVPLTTSYDTLKWDDRLFAVLKDGTRRLAELRGSGRLMQSGVMVKDWSFSPDKPLNPDDVVRYEFELTPLTEIQINNISLLPGHRTNPTVHVVPPAAPFQVKPTTENPGGL